MFIVVPRRYLSVMISTSIRLMESWAENKWIILLTEVSLGYDSPLVLFDVVITSFLDDEKGEV